MFQQTFLFLTKSTNIPISFHNNIHFYQPIQWLRIKIILIELDFTPLIVTMLNNLNLFFY